ncbi:MAG: hypothetical protein K2X50_06800 [Gammaproteobacteria bacterium]|nr:hypothetical protein [Gammaproteobacteria bacterium]
MKVQILGFSLVLLAHSSVFAADAKEAVINRAGVTIGSIEISNKTDLDMAYRISGKFDGFVYGVRAGETDRYVFKGSDTYTSRIETGICRKMDVTGSVCREFDSLQACLNEDFSGFRRYNTVDLLSESSCELVNSYNW